MKIPVEQRYQEFMRDSLRRDLYFLIGCFVLVAFAVWFSSWVWQVSPWLILFPIVGCGFLILIFGVLSAAVDHNALEDDFELEQYIPGQEKISVLAEVRRLVSPTESTIGFIRIALLCILMILLAAISGKKLDEMLGFDQGTNLISIVGPVLFLFFACLGYVAYKKTKKLREKLGDEFVDNDGSGF
jgi:Ca2+/Na+ antiporter